MEFIGKKISVVKKESEVSIVISSTEKSSAAYLMLFWLLCWTACGLYILYEFSKNPAREAKIFMVVFGAFWLYFELRTYKAFMWRRFGREVIKIRDGKFFLKRDVRKRGKIHAYDIQFIKDLRRRELDKQSMVTILSSTDWLELKETIEFDFNNKKIRFGYQLNDEDAQELLRLIRFHLKK